ncbi:MAG TPA: hypothetical protein VHB69_09610 [Mycobacteriales bacterium]|jgi:hypothetical protein|nr:hypothetical protein [Mycobacteriales bacterium]
MRNDEVMVATCLGMSEAELRELAPYSWRELPFFLDPETEGEACEGLGQWFIVGEPMVAVLLINAVAVVVLPPPPCTQSNLGHRTFLIDFNDGRYVVRRDDSRFKNRRSAALRMMSNRATDVNCQGLAK